MNKKDLLFAAMALSVIGLFVVLSVFSRHPKPMTDRPEHAGVSRDTTRESCWVCHAPDSGVAPMPAHHPKKGRPPDQTTPCYACHKYPPSSTNAFLMPRAAEQKGDTQQWLSQLQR